MLELCFISGPASKLLANNYGNVVPTLTTCWMCYPSKHCTPTQCWVNVGATTETLAQHQASIRAMFWWETRLDVIHGYGEASNQCWFDVVPPSAMLGQHQTSMGSTSGLITVMTISVVSYSVKRSDVTGNPYQWLLGEKNVI